MNKEVGIRDEDDLFLKIKINYKEFDIHNKEF